MRADISALTRADIALMPVFQAERGRRSAAVLGGRNAKGEAAFVLLPL